MDRIESYLDSVRKSLDVRTDAERDAIIEDLREHILECVERLEDEGLSHQPAIRRALDEIGDRNLLPVDAPETQDEEPALPPKLGDYLAVVRRGLDVRTDDERESIIAEMGDHLLESIARGEVEGLATETAIERAIEAMGDGSLVATAVSQAHDGGSLQQAWVAALPIVLASIWMAVGNRFGSTVLMWPIYLLFFSLVAGGYLYASSCVPGRKWRPSWLAAGFLAGEATLANLAYWLTLPAGLRQLAVSNHGLSLPSLLDPDVSGNSAVNHWLSGFGICGFLATLALLIFVVTLVLALRRQWIYAALCVAPAAYYGHGLLPIDAAIWPKVLLLLTHYGILYFAILYLFFVDHWNGTWSMAWVFWLVMTVSWSFPPGSEHLAFGAIAALAAALMCYVATRERNAGVIFTVGALLLGFQVPQLSRHLTISGGVETVSHWSWSPVLLVELGVFHWLMGYLQERRLGLVGAIRGLENPGNQIRR